MIHHRYRTAVTAALLSLGLIGALACEEGKGVQSDRPAADRKADPKAKRTVTIRITEASGPYDVWVNATKVGQDRGDHFRDKIAGGTYKQTLDYTSGLKIKITITATGHRSDIFQCEISDGEKRVKERRARQVQCSLTTSR